MNGLIVRLAVTAAVFGAATPAALAQNFSVNGCQPGNAGVTCVNAGGSTLAGSTYADLWRQFVNTAAPNAGLFYAGVGSGSGMRALANNNSGLFGQCPKGSFAVDIGASDATADSSTDTTASVCGANTALNGLSDYIGANKPMPTGGQFIQIPMFVTPIAIPLKNAKVRANGAVVFNRDDYCGIFSGKITNWSQTSQSAKLASGAIRVFYRADGSGTTFLLTSHLAQVCTGGNSNVVFSPTTTFATLFGSVPGNFSGRTGSQALADAVNTTGNSIGYVSPDYTSIAKTPADPGAGNPSYAGLRVAGLKNPTSGANFQPNISGVQSALLNPGGSAANARPPASAGAAANQNNWVPSLPNPANGYPIVGTTQWNLATCYKTSPNKGAQITSFLKQFFGASTAASYNTILNNNGFVQMAKFGSTANWPGAIVGSFASNARGYGLNINGTQCAGVPRR